MLYQVTYNAFTGSWSVERNGSFDRAFNTQFAACQYAEQMNRFL